MITWSKLAARGRFVHRRKVIVRSSRRRGKEPGRREERDRACPGPGDVVQARDVSGGVHFHGPQGSGSLAPQITPRQLPADVSAFINRQAEMRALTRLIPASSVTATRRQGRAVTAVVVVTGAAGIGKTALALHWAHRIRDRFPEGELYANLRGYDGEVAVSAEVVLDRFLRDLGVASGSVPADLDARAAMFRSLIAGRRILVVLDNVAGTGQVRPLIPGGQGPFLIITSRSQLPGLAIRDGAHRVRLDIFQESDAVALLRRVTRTGGRRDAGDDLVELAQLCARLPLALRVAAEHAVSRPTMHLAELIADLRDDSMLWDALSIGDGPHSEGVRTVFAWSYRDLSPEAARMFRVLGLHRGPDISLLVAAAAIAVPVRTARRALDILVGAFLVDTVRPGRYQLHDLLRAYAFDQARSLDSEDDRRETIDRILGWYVASASRARESLLPGSSSRVHVGDVGDANIPSFDTPAAAFEWFDTERPNLIASARSALEAGLPERAWELAMVLGPINAQYFTFDDWSAISEIGVLAATELGDGSALADALDNRGKYLFRRRMFTDALEAHSRALAIREDIGDRKGVLESLNALGLVCLWSRELAQAAAYFEDTVEKARATDEPRWEAIASMNLVEAQLEETHVALALDAVEPLPRLFADRGEVAYEGNSLWLLSWARRLQGDTAAALEAIDGALRIAEDASNRMWEAHWLTEAARVHLAAGDTTEAMRCCRMAASLQRQIGDPSREAMALDCTGQVLLAMGNVADAAAFHQEAARMHRQLGDRWQEALTIWHLAECESAQGHDAGATEQAAQALAIIREFSDDRAAAIAADLQARFRIS
jgi:tetratricopeptide (TPR) repeat protein